MRFVHLVALAPLAFLVACGGAPRQGANAHATTSGGSDAARSEDKGDGRVLSEGEADPDHLKGLSPTQVRAVLGKPMFTRRDAPAEIWQYRGRVCTLDLFLYEDGGRQTVAHVAVRSQQPVDDRQCMGELVSRAAREEAMPAG